MYWDHVTFPGAVPRSFLPPTLLGLATLPLSTLGVAVGVIRTKLQVQILIRLVLAGIHVHCFNHLVKTIRARYGPSVRNWFLVLSMSQFHIPFYAGRTLPNFMILPGVLLSFSWLLRSFSNSAPPRVTAWRRHLSIFLLTFLATNARLELAAFVIPLALTLVLLRKVNLAAAFSFGALGGFGVVLIAGPIDHELWSRALPHASLPQFTSWWQFAWPELASLQYNLFQGQASNWGIMPAHYYFTNSLPKLLMSALPLAVFGLVWAAADKLGMLGNGNSNGNGGKGFGKAVWEIWCLFGPALAGLLGAMSAVGHKEWRFVVYVVPIFNLIAALTAASLWETRATWLRPLMRLGLVGMIMINLLATGFLTFLSMHNYPGGSVWSILEEAEAAQPHRNVSVHFHSYPLQTGASLFTFLHSTTPTSHWPRQAIPNPLEPTWRYFKSEDPGLKTPGGAYDAGFEGAKRGKWGMEVVWGSRAAVLRRV
ncbi:dolichyl-P-Man:Man(7)GlcNAc(2)-PP-dolichol alpha-1,6-mannosyltransferase [Saitozyma podzolica]|uniref:Mannosyltransferase n=1 Tax=Saitozyma podzolica TaxID=1890683 RepID=A0A427YPB6_9TREE|nr:dolichyl-P-Man:Man(7)GlcNAc(2)-PP-dolichol alpha-1,6-mannosyltransferase [Saitozyma podzolica]